MDSTGIVVFLSLIGYAALIGIALHYRNKCIGLTHKLAESYGENNMIACDLHSTKNKVKELEDENFALNTDLELRENDCAEYRARMAELSEILKQKRGGSTGRRK